MDIASEIDFVEIAQAFAARPVWGVVSTFAADSFYEGLTLAEARSLAHQEAAREPGRTARVVLIVRTEEGKPL